MQRHFSNRGEAIAEATAARMSARRRFPLKSAATLGKRAAPAQWIPQPPMMPPTRPVKKREPNTVAGSDLSLPVL
jgi:hypothetical protein